MKPPNCWLSTYMARRPSGAWRTKGPPAVSAVVCGCGRPATVPVVAGIIRPPLLSERADDFAQGGFPTVGSEVLSGPGVHHGHHRLEQERGNDDQFHRAAIR